MGTVRYYWVLPFTVGYCEILSGTVRYFQVLSGTLRYCRVLLGTVGYCQVLSGTVKYCLVHPRPLRRFALIHDSYNCGKGRRMGNMTPWPTRRDGFLYAGFGPTKGYAVRILRKTKCPLLCRPPEHKYWQYC